nr:MAG TPA_asm: hypothetical protein [Caudoviricetes sp.]
MILQHNSHSNFRIDARQASVINIETRGQQPG